MRGSSFCVTSTALLLCASSAWAAPRGAEIVTLCHVPPSRPQAAVTLHLPPAAASEHLHHGDRPGPCPPPAGACHPGRRGFSCDDAAYTLGRLILESENAEEVALLALPDRGTRPPLGNLTSVPPPTAAMGACIEHAFAQEPEVGFAYALARNAVLEVSGAGGFARAPWEDDAPGVAMTPDTRMTIASVSKPVTAVAMMRLLEEHPIALDDPFYPLISAKFNGLFITGDLTIYSIPGPGVAAVTIRHLLTHTSGLKPGLSCGKLRELLGIGTLQAPGTVFDYQNSNYCLLREIIEQVSGLDYIEYVQQNVLHPMGILTMSCERDQTNPALYYNTIGDPGFLWGDYIGSCSAYGWYASARNLAQFLIGVRSHAAISAASTDQMFGDCFDKPGSGEYCLGWTKANGLVGTYLSHSGDWIKNGCYNEATEENECPKGFNGTITRFPLGIDATLFVNTRGGTGPNPPLKSEDTILRECYEQVFQAVNPGP
jgi:CubicO group peptidase (beta-lactamase class C family)